MAAFPNIKREIDPYTTPPASSPECPPPSPLNHISNRGAFSQMPDALGLFNMSHPQQTPLATPATPPITDGWTTQAETAPSTSLPLDSQLSTAWGSSAFTTSPLNWNSPAAYSHALPHHHNAYSNFLTGMEHGFQSHRSSVSSYAPDGYVTSTSTSMIQSPYQMPQSSYGHEQPFKATSYAEMYAANYSTLSSPQSNPPALSPSPAESGSISSETHAVAHHLHSLQGSTKLETSNTTEGDPLAQIARVRRRRRRPRTPPASAMLCPVCGRAFDRKFNYKEHLKVHNPDRERPFACPIEGCQQKPFGRMNDLTRHLNSSVSTSPVL
jgi:hypothetical protein